MPHTATTTPELYIHDHPSTDIHSMFDSSLCRFEVAKKKGEFDEETKRRENAKASLERYMHYFERFDSHSKSRDKVGGLI